MWQIEHQCPQCGAPITLEETERLFACPYCKARLYIASDSILRYYLPPMCFEERIAYVPYWRTKGIDFTCRPSGVTTGVIDRTSLAQRSSCFPYSLGVRPQVFKLRFVGRTVEKALLQPCAELRETHEEVPAPVVLPDGSPISDPVLFRVAMREVESLIFSPVGFQGGMLCDAIDGKNLGRRMDEVLSELSSGDEAPGEVSFIPTLCPNCGADLIGEKESILLFCSACQQAWKVAGGALKSASVAFLPGARGATYLPFWCVRPHLEDMEERLFIDPAKTGRPGSRRVYLDEPGFSFWLPAFKVNASIFLTLAERATVSQPALNDATAEVRDDLYPVTVPADEAAKLAKVVVTLLVHRPEAARPFFARMTAGSDEAQLCFIPFSFSGYELVQQKMRMSILPNALKYGKNL
jgi:predicted RNA-binding Zn-ribbon protein involved in translation (DUF1610 family)